MDLVLSFFFGLDLVWCFGVFVWLVCVGRFSGPFFRTSACRSTTSRRVFELFGVQMTDTVRA